jgi:hypothetical protein
VLLAGLVLGLADVVHTGGAALPVLALWALITAPLALAAGAVLGGTRTLQKREPGEP